MVNFRGKEYNLNSMHTKQLLALRTLPYKFNCSCCGQYEDENGKFFENFPNDVLMFRMAVKEELANREHIFTKEELKSIRKNKKLRGK